CARNPCAGWLMPVGLWIPRSETIGRRERRGFGAASNSVRHGCVPSAFAMNITLVKAVGALIPVCLLITWSGILFARDKTPGRFLQALGAGYLLIVVLTHVAEA